MITLLTHFSSVASARAFLISAGFEPVMDWCWLSDDGTMNAEIVVTREGCRVEYLG